MVVDRVGRLGLLPSDQTRSSEQEENKKRIGEGGRRGREREREEGDGAALGVMFSQGNDPTAGDTLTRGQVQ